VFVVSEEETSQIMGEKSLDSSPRVWQDCAVSWVKPTVSKSQIYAAGKRVAKAGLAERDSVSLIDRWRMAHFLPMVMISSALRQDSESLGSVFLTTARLKRLASIHSKLAEETFKTFRLCRTWPGVAPLFRMSPILELCAGALSSVDANFVTQITCLVRGEPAIAVST
jgi:hypothetical protein